MTTPGSDHLRRAVALAEATMRRGDGKPFGAVVVRDGAVVGEGANVVLATGDPTDHAEMRAIRAACQALGSPDLAGATLYASGEPCPMCLGASYLARLSRIVYATTVAEATRIGNLSEAIYAEYALPAAQRTIPAEHVPLPEASAAFDEWLARQASAAVAEPAGNR